MYEGQKRYYDLRAAEYDRGAWEHASPDVARVIDVVAGLAPARTLDAGCAAPASCRSTYAAS